MHYGKKAVRLRQCDALGFAGIHPDPEQDQMLTKGGCMYLSRNSHRPIITEDLGSGSGSGVQ